jgi:uncharacterized OB-fold protein
LSERIVSTEFPGRPDLTLLPALTPEQQAFEAALGDGLLRLPGCSGCGRTRFPIAPVCPHCGWEAWEWRSLSGLGRVHSWVRYHRQYVPAFEPLVPYSVVTVQMDEGPLLVGRFAGGCEPQTGLRLRAVAERWPEGRQVVAFAPAGDVP